MYTLLHAIITANDHEASSCEINLREINLHLVNTFDINLSRDQL